MKLIDLITYPNISYGAVFDLDFIQRAVDGRPLPRGQYAIAVARDDAVVVARDPLGCNKLFFGRNADGDVVAGSRAVDVWRHGVLFSALGSCPPGQVLELSENGLRRVAGNNIYDIKETPNFDLASFQHSVADAMDQAFVYLARQFHDHKFVVCLSGGLDSSVIASLAIKHLPNLLAASFTYLGAEDFQSFARGTPVEQLASASEDFHCALEVAAALKLPVIPVVRSKSDVSAAIRPSIELCQDWRDFNVHCATVNLFLSEDIRKHFPNEKVVVLTGDLMNELVCDYREERVGDQVYYKIPKIPPAQLRKYFVRGLDAGDREVGVFGSRGLAVCQAFAAAADLYMGVPAAMLSEPEVKWTLNGALLAPKTIPHVNRAKTRAQVGGKDLGTLGLYHELGIRDEQMRQMWREQFPSVPSDLCDGFIQFGRYKLQPLQ